MAGKEWTVEEDQIILSLYPPEGAIAVQEALAQAGYQRTRGSIYQRTRHLNILRDWHWTETEDAVIRTVYPVGGRALAQSTLAELGYERSINSVATRAEKLHIQRDSFWRKHASPRKRAYKALYQSLRTGARDRDLEWSLSFSDFIEIVKNRRCYYCSAEPGRKCDPNGNVVYTHSLDRVNSSKGYTLDNVVPSCKWCNFAKGARDFDDFKRWVADCYRTLYTPD